MKCLELWAGKAIEWSKFSGLLCRILENISVKKCRHGGLACELSGGSKDSIGMIYLN